MDTKSRDLALLAAVSLFCAIFAWAEDRDIFGSVFFALGVDAILGAVIGSGADMGVPSSKAAWLRSCGGEQ